MLWGHMQAVHHTSHRLLQVSYVLGPLTSILNHATTSRYAQLADRITMTLGFLFDMFIIILFHGQMQKAAAPIVGAVVAYLLAKQYPAAQRVFHPLAHLLVTIGHQQLAKDA